MILIIDNYDSFTYNLYQYIAEINQDIEVYRNNKITINEVRNKKPSHIVLSPGPGFPSSAGICLQLVKEIGSEVPILGVCLGHQVIAEAYGGRTVHAEESVHGKASYVKLLKQCRLFYSLPESIQAGRYHSLIVEKSTLPKELEITAVTHKEEIMAVQHKIYPVFGVQFHPESILTPEGKTIINNFLNIA